MAQYKQNLLLEELLEQAIVPESEKPYNVPGNWVWSKLGYAIQVIMGQSPKGEDTTDDDSYIGLIGGASDMADLYPKVSRYTIKPTKISKINDVILSVRATLGRPIFSDGEYCLGRGVAALRSGNISSAFIRYFVLNFEEYLYDVSSGTTFAQVSKNDLEHMPFPLPPFDEQQRIVNRIENLFEKLDQAKDLIQYALDSFENRKAAVLYKAFTGELTKKWRKENCAGLESWKTVTMDRCLKSIEAGKSFRCDERVPQNNEWGIVKVSSVTWEIFNENESKTCLSDTAINEKYLLKKGDFLFSRANTVKLVGKCVIIEDVQKTLMLSDKILRFKFNNIVNPKYILYFLRSNQGRKQIEELSSGNQESMRNIGQSSIRKILVCLPGLREQKEIIRILDLIFKNEQNAKELTDVIDNIEFMKKSILARAFRGELGTNDPEEASSIEILEKYWRNTFMDIE